MDNEIKKDNSSEIRNDKKINWKIHAPLYILEVLVLIIVIVGAVVVKQATKAEKVNLNLSKVFSNISSEESENQTGETSLDSEAGEIVDDNLTENLSNELDTSRDYIAEGNLASEKEEANSVDKAALEKELYDKYNGKFMIAFFGVDSREGDLGAGTRSDSMMICSIDMSTHEVKLISLYRDTYLNLGNGTYNKCNSAYALGGPEQALSMINMNTDLYVDQYITVGFEGLIDAIDALGGVPINVKEEEIFHLNNYQMTMAEQLNLDYVPVLNPGMQMLNGLQATAYCRIRYTAGDDFKRAERQRTVTAAMMERAGKVSLSALTDAASKILPNVSTSLSLSDIISMMNLVGGYEVTVSDGFPFEGLRNGGTIGSKGSCVVPTDLTKNVRKLHKVLFDEEDYKVSDSIKKYNSKIIEDTKDYLQY